MGALKFGPVTVSGWLPAGFGAFGVSSGVLRYSVAGSNAVPVDSAGHSRKNTRTLYADWLRPCSVPRTMAKFATGLPS